MCRNPRFKGEVNQVIVSLSQLSTLNSQRCCYDFQVFIHFSNCARRIKNNISKKKERLGIAYLGGVFFSRISDIRLLNESPAYDGVSTFLFMNHDCISKRSIPHPNLYHIYTVSVETYEINHF